MTGNTTVNNIAIAVGPTLLLIIGGIISWVIKSKSEELKEIEQRLLEKRRDLYMKILEPYIRILAGINSPQQDKVQKEVERIITSLDYRRASIEFLLYGSDDVVLAYNDLMRYFFQTPEGEGSDPLALMRLWAELLRSVRVGLGNKNTELGTDDMLVSMITDLEEYTAKEEGR